MVNVFLPFGGGNLRRVDGGEPHERRSRAPEGAALSTGWCAKWAGFRRADGGEVELIRPSLGALQVMRQDPLEPFLGSKGRKEHGQDRLAGRRGNVDVTSGAETVGNELDQLLEHVQGMKMGLIETVEFFAVLIGSRVFPVDKAEEVPHRSDPFGSR